MKKKETSPKTTRRINNSNDEIDALQIIKKEVSCLSYEEAIKSLDKLLEELQKDDIPVEQMKSAYIKGKVYLEHCEKLLTQVEENLTELNLEELSKDRK